MAATMKHAELVDEVKALGGLVQDVTEREVETRRRVSVIDSRLATVEAGMKTLGDTVTDMSPMLQKNTDLTANTARDVVEIKRVVDRLGPGIETLTVMVSMQQDRDAARRWWGRMIKFFKSSMGLVTVTCSGIGAAGGATWWLWTHFKVVAP